MSEIHKQINKLKYSEFKELGHLAFVTLCLVITWVLFLDWRPSLSMMGHDSIYNLWPILNELVSEGGDWSRLLYRANLIGGVKVHAVFGTLPLFQFLSWLGISALWSLNLFVLIAQMAFVFFGTHWAKSLLILWPDHSTAKLNWWKFIPIYILLGFSPLLAWRIQSGHVNLILGILSFFILTSLVFSIRQRKLTITQIIFAFLVLINCDDFGISLKVNQGIFTLMNAGLIKSISVMSESEGAFQLNQIQEKKNVSVGLHFSLTDLETPPFDKTHSPAKLLVAVKTRRIKPKEVREFLENQYNHLREFWNDEISHLDTHQNIHILPEIYHIIKDFAEEKKIPYIRIPREQSNKWGAKKLLFNSLFPKTKSEITYWGTSFMGTQFNTKNILNQIEYLKKRGVKKSLWAVHVGKESNPQTFKDSYNKARENELDVLMELENTLKGSVSLCSMKELLQ